jgi:ADP-heptose:LPS heptosyltransferase
MAALIANLDLVISVDTAVANLAGSMGAPLWVLGEFDPDFRWTGEGDKTPWFPTARVFRQEKVGEWGPVIERVRCEVRDSMTIKTAC